MITFVILAALGLLLSVISNILSIFGFTTPLGSYIWGLHIGILIVWLPTIIILNIQTRGSKIKDIWRIAYRNCPSWMKVMTFCLIGYAFVNFVLFATFTPSPTHVPVSNVPPPPSIVRFFSGIWMVFYSVALAALYSFTKRNRSFSRRNFFG